MRRDGEEPIGCNRGPSPDLPPTRPGKDTSSGRPPILMSSHHYPHDYHYNDDHELDYTDGRAKAVFYAGRAQRAWQTAAAAQREATPAHSDFFDLAGLIAPALSSLMDLINVLIEQVGDYDRGRAVYDDTRTLDPVVRLAEAVSELRSLRGSLAGAYAGTQGFWSQIAHIGVELDRASGKPGAGA